jgi:tetratricopeptide (TPR) repeat protein
MSALLAITLCCAFQGAPPPIKNLLEDEIAEQSEGVAVSVVSKEGEPEAVDVVAHGTPANEVLARLAQATNRAFKIKEGESVLRANQPLDVNLRHRSLREAALWIAGAAGLSAEVTRKELRCGADVQDKLAPELMLKNAIDGWRVALLADPTQADAARLRFQIANALFELGDYARAIIEYVDLEKTAPAFGDLPYVYFRAGWAHAKLGDDRAATDQWLPIGSTFPHHPLVAAANLESVRAFRRLGQDSDATVVLRRVVETMRDGLAPVDLVTAGELLHEGGDHRRAIDALQWALQSTSDPVLVERALRGLASSQAGLEDWPGVIATAERYLRRKNDGPQAAEIDLLLANAHRELNDPFTALLALARARELSPGGDVALRCDLMEGRIYAGSGLTARAEKCLLRAGASDVPEVAAPALQIHSQLLREQGQLEAAARLLTRLATMRGHENEGRIALAEIALQQKNNDLCLQRVKEALPTADAATRARLIEIATQALNEGDSIDALLEALDTKPADAPEKGEKQEPPPAKPDDGEPPAKPSETPESSDGR